MRLVAKDFTPSPHLGKIPILIVTLMAGMIGFTAWYALSNLYRLSLAREQHSAKEASGAIANNFQDLTYRIANIMSFANRDELLEQSVAEAHGQDDFTNIRLRTNLYVQAARLDFMEIVEPNGKVLNSYGLGDRYNTKITDWDMFIRQKVPGQPAQGLTAVNGKIYAAAASTTFVGGDEAYLLFGGVELGQAFAEEMERRFSFRIAVFHGVAVNASTFQIDLSKNMPQAAKDGTVTILGERFILTKLPLVAVDGQALGYILVGAPLTAFDQAVTNTVWNTLLIILVPFLLTSGLTWLLGRTIIRAVHDLRASLADNQRMVKIIASQNAELEIKVTERTAQLQQKTDDIQNMLQNMKQGIFTIRQGNIVDHEYSKHLEKILDTNDIAGRNIMELLFSAAELDADVICQIESALAFAMGSNVVSFLINQESLVKKIRVTLANGASKILELEWNAIVTDAQVVRQIMVVVRDITELLALQEKTKAHETEISMLTELIANPSSRLSGALTASEKLLDETLTIVNTNHGNLGKLQIERMFRNLHTAKGTARTYGLRRLAEGLHQVESTYVHLIKNPHAVVPWQQLTVDLQHVVKIRMDYQRVFDKRIMADRDIGFGIRVDEARLIKVIGDLRNTDMKNRDNLNFIAETVRHELLAIGKEPLDTVLAGLLRSLPTIAEDAGRLAPDVRIDSGNVFFTRDRMALLEEVFTHLIGNALTHGIESADDRSNAGKPPNGVVTIVVAGGRPDITLTVTDDGRGLDIEGLREKGVALGCWTNTAGIADETVAELIFTAGVSTTAQVTTLSGRGVGMDAVRGFLADAGGGIRLAFTGPRRGAFRSFKLVISLPSDQFVAADLPSQPLQATG